RENLRLAPIEQGEILRWLLSLRYRALLYFSIYEVPWPHSLRACQGGFQTQVMGYSQSLKYCKNRSRQTLCESSWCRAHRPALVRESSLSMRMPRDKILESDDVF